MMDVIIIMFINPAIMMKTAIFMSDRNRKIIKIQARNSGFLCFLDNPIPNQANQWRIHQQNIHLNFCDIQSLIALSTLPIWDDDPLVLGATQKIITLICFCVNWQFLIKNNFHISWLI